MILYKGTEFKDKDGNDYTVDEVISVGTGQGDIYRVHNQRKEKFALKLFHTGNKKKLLAQIEKLIKRGQACEAFVMPIELVEVDGRIGYIMEYIGSEFISAAALFNGIEMDGRMVNLTWHEKIMLLAQIVDALIVLNDASLGIYDVKFDNLKIDLTNLRVKILDTDTIVYTKDKSVVVGTVGFMPPLTHIGKEKPNEYNDVYAVAVLIYMTLLGAHPLDGKRRNCPCNENIDTYLFGTHPVYMFHPTDASNRPIPKDGFGRNQQQVIDKMRRYPAYFRKAMNATFVDGLYDGTKRTTLHDWLDILEQLYNDSFVCENCGEEYFLDGTEKVCGICGKEIAKPIFMECEKRIPLFNGLTIYCDDLWAITSHYEVFRVVETRYDGRYGLENLTYEQALLRLVDGKERRVDHGAQIPIFMDSEVEIENHKIKFI